MLAPRGVDTELVGSTDAAARGTRADAAAHIAGPHGCRASYGDARNRSLVLFDSGDEVVVQAGDEGIRFLLVSGKPLQEPVAWYGPIVMNTQDGAAAGHQ